MLCLLSWVSPGFGLWAAARLVLCGTSLGPFPLLGPDSRLIHTCSAASARLSLPLGGLPQASVNFIIGFSSLGRFPGGLDGKASAGNAGDLGSIHGSGTSPGEGNGNPLQYSSLEIPWMEKPGGLHSPWGPKELDTTERLHLLFSFLVVSGAFFLHSIYLHSYIPYLCDFDAPLCLLELNSLVTGFLSAFVHGYF